MHAHPLAMQAEAGGLGVSYPKTYVIDLMNVMTYDFRGGWATTGPTNFHSNLYPDLASPGGAEEKTWSVDTAVNTYLQAGAPAQKLVVGVPYTTGAAGAASGAPTTASIRVRMANTKRGSTTTTCWLVNPVPSTAALSPSRCGNMTAMSSGATTTPKS